ncbi:hypothetical protein ASZ90_017061 [hydrocarbon metagenome]|uniref:Uncharacterized protein n=1 Tax=hydrocarbon metagenome TaxID=938273 RepID=A0A0W8EAN3_9ZZZZ
MIEILHPKPAQGVERYDGVPLGFRTVFCAMRDPGVGRQFSPVHLPGPEGRKDRSGLIFLHRDFRFIS